MNTKKAIEIASRIYGLYLLIQIPLALLGLLSAYAVDNEQFFKNPILYRVWATMLPLLYIIIATFLISKAKLIAKIVAGSESEIANQKDTNSPSHTRLSFWIILLGIYFLISSGSKLIQSIVGQPIQLNNSYLWALVLSQGSVALLSLFLILKSEWLESKIVKKVKR